jgi:hypothetical protein
MNDDDSLDLVVGHNQKHLVVINLTPHPPTALPNCTAFTREHNSITKEVMTMHRLRAALRGPSRTPRVKNLGILEILVRVFGWTITIVVIKYHLSQIGTFLHHPYAAEKAYATTPDAYYHLVPANNDAVKRPTRSQVMSALEKMHNGRTLDRGEVANILNESKTSLQTLDRVYSVPIQKKDQEGNSPYSSKEVTVSIRAAAMYCIQLLGSDSSNCFVSPNIDCR